LLAWAINTDSLRFGLVYLDVWWHYPVADDLDVGLSWKPSRNVCIQHPVIQLMNNAPAILKSLVIYAICVPLAVIIGYMLTDPLQFSTFAYAGVVGLVLFFPLLLRWHYPLLLFSIGSNVIIFFLMGRPAFWLVMVALSLGISVLERAMSSQKHFIRVPQITWPLICMIGVVFLTAKLTGGMGLRSLGSDVYGGKKYIFLVMSILCYFALTAQRIPPERAKLYAALFILGPVTNLVGDLYPITPSFLHFIFWLFPLSGSFSPLSEVALGKTRLSGVATAALTIVYWLMARYGLRGILLSGKLWRPVLFVLASMMICLGGFRGMIIVYLFTFGLIFFLEGLHRTRMLLVFAMAGLLIAVAIIPLAPRLPYTFQRSLAFLPLNLGTKARDEARDSSEWRVKMWKALVPQVPAYLLLGKGYVITMEDFEFMGMDTAFHSVDASQQGLALSSDFHNGPLSVVIPFGIWGVIAFLWLIFAGLRVVHCNYRYGDESLRTINTFLWAYYLSLLCRFTFIFGALNSDMIGFAAIIGFSVALNGGVCRPAAQPVQARQPMVHPAKILPRPRPAFQR